MAAFQDYGNGFGYDFKVSNLQNDPGDTDDSTDEDCVPWSDPEKREKKPSGPAETKPKGPDEEKEEQSARGGSIPNPEDQERARHLHGYQ